MNINPNKKEKLIRADPALVEWLDNAVGEGAPDSAKELLAGLGELVSGEISSLVIGAEEGRRPADAGDITAGKLEIRLRSRKVLFAGNEIMLTPKEFDILYFLAENRGEVFTKEQIYKAVWSDNYLLDDSNIMAFIRKLRKKIEPDPDAPKYILTIWGIGYKFNDEI